MNKDGDTVKKKKGRTFPPAADRLWAKVIKTDSCWLWTGGKDGYGYGRIRVGNGKTSKTSTHRLSWKLANGPIPDGMYVLHKCDTAACVRPDHLFLGTQQDNVDDCIRKGRYKFRPNGSGSRGEYRNHPNKKLTAEQVSCIRSARYYRGVVQALALQFGVSERHIQTLRDNQGGWHWIAPSNPLTLTPAKEQVSA